MNLSGAPNYIVASIKSKAAMKKGSYSLVLLLMLAALVSYFSYVSPWVGDDIEYAYFSAIKDTTAQTYLSTRYKTSLFLNITIIKAQMGERLPIVSYNSSVA